MENIYTNKKMVILKVLLSHEFTTWINYLFEIKRNKKNWIRKISFSILVEETDWREFEKGSRISFIRGLAKNLVIEKTAVRFLKKIKGCSFTSNSKFCADAPNECLQSIQTSFWVTIERGSFLHYFLLLLLVKGLVLVTLIYICLNLTIKLAF